MGSRTIYAPSEVSATPSQFAHVWTWGVLAKLGGSESRLQWMESDISGVGYCYSVPCIQQELHVFHQLV